jgi:hypothetical protein
MRATDRRLAMTPLSTPNAAGFVAACRIGVRPGDTECLLIDVILT